MKKFLIIKDNKISRVVIAEGAEKIVLAPSQDIIEVSMREKFSVGDSYLSLVSRFVNFIKKPFGEK